MNTVKRIVVPSLALLSVALCPLLASCATGTSDTNSDQNNNKPSKPGAGGEEADAHHDDSDNVGAGGNDNGSGGGTTGTGGDGPAGGCVGASVTEGGDEGQCCDAPNYQATCINDNANALVCLETGGVGKVHKWNCADKGCQTSADNPKDVVCPTPSDQCVLPPNLVATKTYTKNQPCPEELTKSGLCKADKSEGYYCKKDPNNPAEKIVAIWTCANNDCAIDSSTGPKCGYVMCGNGGSTTECTLPEPQTTTTTYKKDQSCPDALKSIKGLCKADRTEGYYCSAKGKVAVKKCAQKDCVLDPKPGNTCGYVQCESDLNAECTGTKVTSGGNVGDCCDKQTYVPGGCVEGGNYGLYCRPPFVAKWTCTAPKKCTYDASEKWYSCK